MTENQEGVPQRKALTRVFKFENHTLTDPDPQLTPQQVKDFYAALHPGLLNAGIGSPKEDLQAGTVEYAFVASMGRKG